MGFHRRAEGRKVLGGFPLNLRAIESVEFHDATLESIELSKERATLRFSDLFGLVREDPTTAGVWSFRATLALKAPYRAEGAIDPASFNVIAVVDGGVVDSSGREVTLGELAAGKTAAGKVRLVFGDSATRIDVTAAEISLVLEGPVERVQTWQPDRAKK